MIIGLFVCAAFSVFYIQLRAITKQFCLPSVVWPTLHLDTQTGDAENSPMPRGNLWETRKMSERDVIAGWAEN